MRESNRYAKSIVDELGTPKGDLIRNLLLLES